MAPGSYRWAAANTATIPSATSHPAASMGCGKHGDYPVRDLASGRINIAVLNQTYRFDSVEGTGLTPTHVLVPEGYVLGFENKEDKVYGIQFHLESAPGPQDYVYLFDKFIQMMEEQRYA